MNAVLCPKCKGENTFCVNDFLEYALEIRECEDCNTIYEIVYDMVVKEIRIKK